MSGAGTIRRLLMETIRLQPRLVLGLAALPIVFYHVKVYITTFFSFQQLINTAFPRHIQLRARPLAVRFPAIIWEMFPRSKQWIRKRTWSAVKTRKGLLRDEIIMEAISTLPQIKIRQLTVKPVRVGQFTKFCSFPSTGFMSVIQGACESPQLFLTLIKLFSAAATGKPLRM